MSRESKHDLSRPTMRICESHCNGATHSLRVATKDTKRAGTDRGHIPVSILHV